MLTLPLTRFETASARQRLLTIDLDGQVFNYEPGQAARIGPHGHASPRPYSIACSPERANETGAIQFLIALDAAGDDLGWAQPGTLVDIDGPLGTFTVPPSIDVAWVLFVAGGTGIAPVRAMLDRVLRRHPTQRVSLLYSTRRSDEFAFLDELRAHERDGRLEFHPTVTRDDDESWGGKRGRIGRDHFEAVLHDPSSTMCFLCGPPTLVLESATTLQMLGVPEDAIRTEDWVRPTSR